MNFVELERTVIANRGNTTKLSGIRQQCVERRNTLAQITAKMLKANKTGKSYQDLSVEYGSVIRLIKIVDAYAR